MKSLDSRWNRFEAKRTMRVLLVLLAVWALPALAADDGVGKAIFVIGEATLVPAAGPPIVLKKGQILHVGDRIDTSDKGQVQIRMIDGAFIAVRPGSSFLVSKYHLDQDAAKNESEFDLIKGGFRAITGKIGKTNKKGYKVKTPAATLGIRGTDYVAIYCDNDCDKRDKRKVRRLIENGLYVGVISGGVHLENEVGSIDVDKNEYAFIAGWQGELRHIDRMPGFLMFDTVVPGDDDLADRGEGRDKRGSVESDDGEKVSGVKEDLFDSYWDYAQYTSANILDFSARKSFVYAYGATSASSIMASAGNVTGPVVDLGAGVASVTLVSMGSATEYDLGYDPITGLTWGRWAGGAVNVADPTTGVMSSADLGSESLHWISGGNLQDQIVLPITGIANYVVIGNTSPTDNYGNVGVLGSASLSADFTSMTMNASISLGINNQVWDGTAAGVPIDSAAATFGGGMAVSVSDSVTLATAVGTGTMAGAFAVPSPTGGAPGAAAISYSMSADINALPTTVTGVAALELVP